MPPKKATPEIRIRKMRYENAKQKLESELNSAFIAGKTRVAVIHGIGTGQLKALTRRVISELGLGKIVEEPLDYNPGVTLVDLVPPDPMTLRQYMK